MTEANFDDQPKIDWSADTFFKIKIFDFMCD